jgi:hypothetical protein
MVSINCTYNKPTTFLCEGRNYRTSEILQSTMMAVSLLGVMFRKSRWKSEVCIGVNCLLNCSYLYLMTRMNQARHLDMTCSQSSLTNRIFCIVVSGMFTVYGLFTYIFRFGYHRHFSKASKSVSTLFIVYNNVSWTSIKSEDGNVIGFVCDGADVWQVYVILTPVMIWLIGLGVYFVMIGFGVLFAYFCPCEAIEALKEMKPLRDKLPEGADPSLVTHLTVAALGFTLSSGIIVTSRLINEVSLGSLMYLSHIVLDLHLLIPSIQTPKEVYVLMRSNS